MSIFEIPKSPSSGFFKRPQQLYQAKNSKDSRYARSLL